MIDVLLDLLLGLVLVYAFLRVSRQSEAITEVRSYAYGLVVAAGIYVAFGLVLGGRPLAFELVQFAIFVGIAVSGLRYSPLILAAGWLLHSGWDATHLYPSLSQHAPEWYVFACLSFDVVLAVYIIVCRHRFDVSPNLPPSTIETSDSR